MSRHYSQWRIRLPRIPGHKPAVFPNSWEQQVDIAILTDELINALTKAGFVADIVTPVGVVSVPLNGNSVSILE